MGGSAARGGGGRGERKALKGAAAAVVAIKEGGGGLKLSLAHGKGGVEEYGEDDATGAEDEHPREVGPQEDHRDDARYDD